MSDRSLDESLCGGSREELLMMRILIICLKIDLVDVLTPWQQERF